MDGKVLGKIQKIDLMEEYGHIYLQVELGSDIPNAPEGNWGVQNSYPIIPGEKAIDLDKWTIFPLADIMQAAQVSNLQSLKGKPVEATFEGNLLKHWRILTEAI